ncbi:MAG: hypothetical protein ABTR20_13545 [Candidatus Competibacter sp.]
MAINPDSVSNEIQSTMSLARNQAQSAIAAANTMVTNAVSQLTHYTPDYPTDPVVFAEQGYSVSGSGFSAEQKPPVFPTIRTPSPVTMGALGDLDSLEASFTEAAPSLILPDFNYASLTPLTPFSGTAPTIDAAVTIPDAPSFQYPGLPQLLALNTTISLPDLVIPPLAIQSPTYTNLLATDFLSAFTAGRAAVPNPDEYGTQLVNRYYPGLHANYTQLSARVNGILGGTATALTDTADDRLYESLRTRIAGENDKAEQALNEASQATGWDLPGAVRAAGGLRLRQDLAVELSKAALEVYGKRTDRELQHLQFVMGLANDIHGAAITLFGSAFGMQMQAFQGALQYADAAIKFATTVYELKQRDFELLQRLTDTQVRIFEALLKAELAKTDVTKAKIDIERLKSELNHDLITQYTAQLQGEETKARVYASQIDALRETIAARKLPLEVFLANVQGFSALSDAKKAEYALLEARISGDKAKVEGELAKLKVYQTKAEVFSTVTGAKAKKIDSQIQRNQQILDEFKTKMQAELQLVQIDEAIAKHSLNAFEAMAKIYIAESEERLNQAKFDFQKNLETMNLELEQTRFAYERQFKNLEVEMTRVKALAEIQLSGATVQSHVGAAAMSVMNTMVQLEASVSG